MNEPVRIQGRVSDIEKDGFKFLGNNSDSPSLPVRVSDDEGEIINPSTEDKQDTIISKLITDPTTGALISQCCDEYQTNLGNRYKLNDPIELGNNDTREWLIVTPDSDTLAHVTFHFDGDLAGRAQLFENTTKTGGTALTLSNRNRNSSNTSALTVTHTPTGTGDGDGGPYEYFGGGRS